MAEQRGEHRLAGGHNVLDFSGRVMEAGYAFSPILKYDRRDIRTGKLRIKEWDYYMVTGGDYSVAFTLSDHYYMALNTLGFIKHGGGGEFAKTLKEIELFPMGKYGFPPPDEKKELRFDGKKLSLRYLPTDKGMIITGQSENFFKKRFYAHFELTDFPRDEMVICTPFADRRYFYYNRKINCISASGYVIADGERIDFEKGKSFAVYDCGRGAWTLKNRWYWATTSDVGKNGDTIGLNLGYGFGDTSAASENMLFVNGIAHKLGRVKIDLPMRADGKEDCMGGEWLFTEADGRLRLRFLPVVVRQDNVRAAFIYSKQKQTFGRFVGYAITDDGAVIEIDQTGACEIFDNNG